MEDEPGDDEPDEPLDEEMRREIQGLLQKYRSRDELREELRKLLTAVEELPRPKSLSGATKQLVAEKFGRLRIAVRRALNSSPPASPSSSSAAAEAMPAASASAAAASSSLPPPPSSSFLRYGTVLRIHDESVRREAGLDHMEGVCHARNAGSGHQMTRSAHARWPATTLGPSGRPPSPVTASDAGGALAAGARWWLGGGSPAGDHAELCWPPSTALCGRIRCAVQPSELWPYSSLKNVRSLTRGDHA